MINKAYRFFCCFLVYVFSIPVFAKSEALAVNWLESLGALLAVIAVIVILAWILKRTPLGGSRLGGLVKVIAAHPLGYKEKILVVKVGQEQLVLGVSSQQITFLCKLEQPLSANEPCTDSQHETASQVHAQNPMVTPKSSIDAFIKR